MKVFVGLLACLGLVIAGLFVAALLVPPAEEEDDGGMGMASSMFAAGPDAEASEPLRNVMLSADKQKKIWNVEHLSFVVEKRFGQRFCSALGTDKAQDLKNLFLSDAEVQIPEWDDPVEQTVVAINVSTLEAESKESSLDVLLKFLSDETAAFAQVTEKRFDVQKLEAESTSAWTAHLSLHLTGLDEQDRLLESVSRHVVRFRIDDALKLDSAPGIAGWQVCSVTRRRAESLMKEVTEEVGLSRLATQLPDNWITTKKQVHRFQIAVDDYDNDGDPDIATADRERRRVLYRGEDGGFVYATKSLQIPREFSSELAGYTTLWFDFDNDGFKDLLSGPNLFHSEEGKSLTDVSRKAGIYIAQDPQNVAAADFDCDGDLDLYFTHLTDRDAQRIENWVREDTTSGVENELWENLGNGTFRNIAQSAGASGGKNISQSATWFYFDADHYPDLFIASETRPPVVLRNKGDGTFEDLSDQLGFTDKVLMGTGAVAADFNNDGLTDVYMNNGYSRYAERILAAVSPSDYPEDTLERMRSLASGSRMYRATTEGGFEDVSASTGTRQVGWAWGATAFDINSDGWLDLYSTCGLSSRMPGAPDAESCMWRGIATHPVDRGRSLPPIGQLDKEMGEFWTVNMEMANRMKKNVAAFQRNRLFVSDRGDNFVDASAVSGADVVADSRSAVPADIDSDGDLDLIVASAGGGSLRVFRNEVPQGHRLDIRFRGTTSNHFGIGCRVTAEFSGRRIVRDLFPSAGFMATGPSRVWLGLGDAERIDRLSIRWPTGETQVFTDVAADRRIRIHEDKEEIETLLEF